jgi:hypothetical protein
MRWLIWQGRRVFWLLAFAGSAPLYLIGLLLTPIAILRRWNYLLCRLVAYKFLGSWAPCPPAAAQGLPEMLRKQRVLRRHARVVRS